MSDLIVVTFDNEETAVGAMESVRRVEHGGGFGLTDTAVIVKERSGTVRVKNEWSSAAETGAVVGGVFGALATFFFPPIGAAVGAGLGALVGSRFETGVDQQFVRDVGDALTPGSSALFLMVKEGGDPAAVVAALKVT